MHLLRFPSHSAGPPTLCKHPAGRISGVAVAGTLALPHPGARLAVSVDVILKEHILNL